MELNKQHLKTVHDLNNVHDLTVLELGEVVVVGMLVCFFAYLLWQVIHVLSQEAVTLIRGLIPRIG